MLRAASCSLLLGCATLWFACGGDEAATQGTAEVVEDASPPGDATHPGDTDPVAEDTVGADDATEGDIDAPAPPDATEADAADDVSDDVSEDATEDAAGDAGDTTSPQDVEPPSPNIGELCFAEILDPDGAASGPDYDPMGPVVGSHCFGTNHQTIEGVERVVVLGDSVAQGTPNLAHPLPTQNAHFWRNLLAEWLADRFGLDRGNSVAWGFWKAYNALDGTGGALTSGDFWNCSKWGARTDDFIVGGAQIPKCFPDGGSADRTLTVFTMGGNDIAAITKRGGEASPEEVAAGYPQAWALAYSTVDYLREAVAWLTDPQRFPNGSYVVFANPFEFTDGTGEVGACPAAGFAGLSEWEQPEVQAEIVIWILEQYMEIAIDSGTDLIWMLEHFCGHGWVATGPNADPGARCYRGPDAERWFDETCIHPNAKGHHAIYEMFRAVVEEE